MLESRFARSVPVSFALLLACSGEARMAPASAASSVAAPATSSGPPTLAHEETASTAPVSPERVPEPTPPVLVPRAVLPLGPFDRSQVAKTKLALIQRVDAALRAGDPARLGAAWLDAAAITAQCPKGPAATELAAALDEGRERAATAFADCLALADWSRAEYLVLNYGSNRTGRKEACPAWERHESSELFYAIDDVVHKVGLQGALASRGGHALAGSIRCSRKGGSAEEFRRVSRAYGQPCPGQPWPVLTQVRGPCPRLE